METHPLPEVGQEPSIKKPPRELSRIQKWTRAAVVGLLIPLAASAATTAAFEPSHFPFRSAFPHIQAQDIIPGTLSEERRNNPPLTEDDYLDLLASRLNTPERIGRFFDERIPNSPTKGLGEREPKGEDHWQTPKETIRREERRVQIDVNPITKQGVQQREVSLILGDCEDYAFLAQEILWRQGKIAHVINFPGEGHSACIWIEKTSDDQYHGFSLDNGGLFWNEQSFKNIDFSNPPSGYNTLTEGFNAVTNKYEGTTAYNMNPAFIPVSRLRGPLKYVDAVTLQAFSPDLPHIPSYLDFFIAMGLCSTAYSLRRLLQRRKGGETWKEYFTKFRLV